MKARTEMTPVTGEYVQTLYDLATSNLGESSSHSSNGLANVGGKAWKFLCIQTERDMATPMGTGK